MNNYEKGQKLTSNDWLYKIQLKNFYTRKFDGEKMVKVVKFNPSMDLKMDCHIALEMLPVLYK